MNLDSLKLTVYFGERQRVGGRFFADALLDLCGEHQIATSLLLRGAEGFGLSHALRTDRLLTLSEDLPLTAVAVDARARVESLLDDLRQVDHRGLVTLERAWLAATMIAVDLLAFAQTILPHGHRPGPRRTEDDPLPTADATTCLKIHKWAG